MLKYVKERIVDRDTYYIILDEVQLLAEFEDVLNSFMHIRNADVYVTGSNSKFLSSDLVTEFRGRGDEIRIYPLSFREYCSVYEGSADEAWDDYFTYGGLPLILSRETPEEKAEYLMSLFQKVYLSDIVDRHKVRNREELDELVDILASAVGSLTNPSKIAKTFASVKGSRISDETIARYLDDFTDAFLLYQAKRYDVKGRKYIGSPFKYYFSDVGLRNARLNFRQQEENHIMENVIFNELLIRNYSVDVGIVPYNFKVDGKSQRTNLEVDFVANKDTRRYYIQSAFSIPDDEKREQEIRPLAKVGDSFKKIVVVRDDIVPWHDETGILYLGIEEFLLNESAMDA